MISVGVEPLRCVIDHDRGGHVRSLALVGGRELLYHDVGLGTADPVHTADDEHDWLARYRGGWHELFPNVGHGCVVDGRKHPFHGDASVAPWTVRTDGPTRVVLWYEDAEVRLEKRLEVLDATVRIDERATDATAHPIYLLWGHHPAFVAIPDARIDIPAEEVVVPAYQSEHWDLRPGTWTWPRALGSAEPSVNLSVVPSRAAERLCFLPSIIEGWAAISNAPSRIGVALAWDATVWPHAWLWEQVGGTSFPWRRPIADRRHRALTMACRMPGIGVGPSGSTQVITMIRG